MKIKLLSIDPSCKVCEFVNFVYSIKFYGISNFSCKYVGGNIDAGDLLLVDVVDTAVMGFVIDLFMNFKLVFGVACITGAKYK